MYVKCSQNSASFYVRLCLVNNFLIPQLSFQGLPLRNGILPAISLNKRMSPSSAVAPTTNGEPVSPEGTQGKERIRAI